MVKGYTPILVEAIHEATIRTVGLSDKPFIGKTLFPESCDVGGEVFHCEFESERFIHGKIRQLTLRSESHWKSVEALTPQRGANVGTIRLDNQGHVVSDYLKIAHILYNSSFFDSIELPRIQHGLKQIVIAHMIRSHINQINQVVHQSGRHIHVDKNLFTQDIAPGVSGATLSERLNSEASLGLSPSDGNRMVSSANNTSSVEQLRMMIAIMIALGMMKSSTTSPDENGSLNSKKMLESDAKPSPQNSISDTLRALSCNSPKLVKRCFGTAPIWYEQSMETGPPHGHNLLDNSNFSPGVTLGPSQWDCRLKGMEKDQQSRSTSKKSIS